MTKNYIRIAGIFLLIGIGIFSFYNFTKPNINDYKPIVNTTTETPSNHNGLISENHIVLFTPEIVNIPEVHATSKITITPTIKPTPIITASPIPRPSERHTAIKNSVDAQKVMVTSDGAKTYNLAYQPPLYLGYEYYYVGDYAVWYATLSNVGDTDIINPTVRISVNNIPLIEKKVNLIINAHSNKEFWQDFNIPNMKGFWRVTIDLLDQNGNLCISFYKELNIL